MSTVSLIFTSIQISLFGLIILLAFIYSITVLCPRRFRSQINIFTVNLCVAVTGCSLYWMIYYVMLEFNVQQLFAPNTCTFLVYAQMLCTLQVPLAFLIFSIHRLCSIVYHTKPFFKTKLWVVICVISQWITGFVLSLPIFLNASFCTTAEWKRVYILIVIVVIPSLIYIIINSIIFVYAHSSSRRIQPQITTPQPTGNNIIDQRLKLSHRDVRLLQHMIFMFCVFVGGWAPIHIVTILMTSMTIDVMVFRVLSILAELSLLCDILDLYIYNHEIRQYLKNIILKCF